MSKSGQGVTTTQAEARLSWRQQPLSSGVSKPVLHGHCAVASFVRRLVMPAGLHNPVAFVCCALVAVAAVVVSRSSHALNCCSLLLSSVHGGGVCRPCKSFQAAALRQCSDATRQLTRRGAVLSRHCRLICDACGQCADCLSVSDCHLMFVPGI